MLIRWLIYTLSVIVTSFLLPGVHLKGFFSALGVALVLGLLNLLVKPVLILLTIPITIFTFGFFLLVINAVIILMASDLINGFAVDGFWWALGFSLILSLVDSLLYPRREV
jgi:putative membrane protein